MAESETPTVVSDLKRKGQALLANEHARIQSAVLHDGEGGTMHLFAMPEGEAFPTHDTSHPATIHVVAGQARITLGDETVEASPHAWIHMPPNLPHSIEARSPFVFTLHLAPARDA